MQSDNRISGIVFISFALLILCLWIPFDVETGFFEKHRRQYSIGDALAPSAAAAFILVGGGLLVWVERNSASASKISFASLRYVSLFLVIVLVSFSIMRWAGPITIGLVNLFVADELSYRLLRDTPGWKHIGFGLGGTFLIVSLISLVVGKLTWQTVLIAMLAVLVMIGIYDLPFDDLLLPPNGDV